MKSSSNIIHTRWAVAIKLCSQVALYKGPTICFTNAYNVISYQSWLNTSQDPYQKLSMLILEWQYVFFNKPGQMSILFGVAYLISTQASFIFPSNNFMYLHGNVLERRVSMSRCSVFIQTFLITKSSKSMNQVGRCRTNIV